MEKQKKTKTPGYKVPPYFSNDQNNKLLKIRDCKLTNYMNDSEDLSLIAKHASTENKVHGWENRQTNNRPIIKFLPEKNQFIKN